MQVRRIRCVWRRALFLLGAVLLLPAICQDQFADPGADNNNNNDNDNYGDTNRHEQAAARTSSNSIDSHHRMLSALFATSTTGEQSQQVAGGAAETSASQAGRLELSPGGAREESSLLNDLDGGNEFYIYSPSQDEVTAEETQAGRIRIGPNSESGRRPDVAASGTPAPDGANMAGASSVANHIGNKSHDWGLAPPVGHPEAHGQAPDQVSRANNKSSGAEHKGGRNREHGPAAPMASFERRSGQQQQKQTGLGAGAPVRPQPYCIGHQETESTFGWACQGFQLARVPGELHPAPTSL